MSHYSLRVSSICLTPADRPGRLGFHADPSKVWINPGSSEGGQGLAELNHFCESFLAKYIELSGGPKEKASLEAVSVVDIVVEFDVEERAMFRPLEVQDGAWVLDFTHWTSPWTLKQTATKIAESLVQYAAESKGVQHP